MDHLFVLADSETLLGFRLAGVRHAQSVPQTGDVDAIISKALETPNVGILVLTHDVSERASAKMKKRLDQSTKPVIVVIPSKSQKTVSGSSSLALLVKKAMGVDLFKDAANESKNKTA